jgi:hypothetical protein
MPHAPHLGNVGMQFSHGVTLEWLGKRTIDSHWRLEADDNPAEYETRRIDGSLHMFQGV